MEKNKNFPLKLAAPAKRALANAGITELKQIPKFSEVEIMNLHGIGKNAVLKIKKALLDNGLSFKSKYKTTKR